MKSSRAFRASLLGLLLIVAAASGCRRGRPALHALLPIFVVGLVSRGRDPRREIEEQAAYEEAERVRAERRAGVVFEGFVDSSPAAIELFDVDGRPLRSNKAAERLLGKVPPPGIRLNDARGLRRAGLLEPQLKRVLAGTRVETPQTWYDPTEIGLPGIPGRKVCFRATVFPLFDSDGKVVRLAIMYEDLTELKKLEQETHDVSSQAARGATTPDETAAPNAAIADARDIEFQRRKIESALRESEERYRSLVDSARGYAITRFSEDGHIVAVSRAVEDFLGIKRETIMLDNGAFFGRVHPEDIERVKSAEAEARKTGQYPAGYEFRVVHMSTNAVTWLEGRGSASTFAGKRLFDLLLVDISSRKRIEQVLADREKKLGAITSSPTDGVFTLDKDWTVTGWSPGTEKETRIAPAEAVGRRLWEIYPDMEKSGFGATLRKTMIEKNTQHFEGFYQDGREKYAGWFTVDVYPYDAGALAFIRNVSIRKRAELAWRDADSKLRALLDQPTLGITLKDSKLRYVLANPAAHRMMAFRTDDSLVGKTDPEIYNSPVAALLAASDKLVLEKGQTVEMEIALPDAASPTSTWYHITKQPWLGADAAVTGVLAIAGDITTRVRAQQELLRRREYLERLVAEQAQVMKHTQEELARWAR